MDCVQYTVRGVPAYLDAGLRGYAQREEKSLNAVLVELLERGLSLLKHQPKNRELMELVGTWVDDPDSDQAFDEMRQIDEELWK